MRRKSKEREKRFHPACDVSVVSPEVFSRCCRKVAEASAIDGYVS